MKIILEANLENISSRVDNSWTIKLSTQEIDGNNIGQLSDLKKAGGYCKVLISNSNITTLESELVDNTSIAANGKNKTKSQRLRAVLFLKWQQSGINTEFDNYYDNRMEGLIDKEKEGLN